MRHLLAQRRWLEGFRGIQRRRELARFDEAVDACGLRALFVGEFLDFLDVALDGRCEILEVERQERRVRHAQRGAPGCLREHDAVGMPGVDEALVVFDGVVEGVVAAALGFAA